MSESDEQDNLPVWVKMRHSFSEEFVEKTKRVLEGQRMYKF